MIGGCALNHSLKKVRAWWLCTVHDIHPPITPEERPNGVDTRMKINEMLDKNGAPQYFRIRAVGYSGAGNIKITSTDSCKALDLMAYSKLIAEAITPNKVLSVLPDMEHHRIKINKIPTWGVTTIPLPSRWSTMSYKHTSLNIETPNNGESPDGSDQKNISALSISLQS